jgi:hypothetical protein
MLTKGEAAAYWVRHPVTVSITDQPLQVRTAGSRVLE